MQRNFSVILPLKKRDRIDPGDLITEIRLLVEQTGATVRIDPRMAHQAATRTSGLLSTLRGGAQPEIFAFELDGVRLRVSNHNEPFADRSDIGRYVNPVMWDQGLGEFTDHRAHFKIHEAGIEGEEGPDATFDRAAAVTATASVVARFTEPVGAVWLSARNSVPTRSFADALGSLTDGVAPLRFWLRWHVLAPEGMEEHNSGLLTAGLAPFVGHEILARPSTADTRVMIEHAFELARRMIDEKMTFSDGQTVEGAGGEKLRIRLGVRHRREEAPVCEIALANPPAKIARGARGPVLPDGLALDPLMIGAVPPIVAPRPGEEGLDRMDPAFEPERPRPEHPIDAPGSEPEAAAPPATGTDGLPALRDRAGTMDGLGAASGGSAHDPNYPADWPALPPVEGTAEQTPPPTGTVGGSAGDPNYPADWPALPEATARALGDRAPNTGAQGTAASGGIAPATPPDRPGAPDGGVPQEPPRPSAAGVPAGATGNPQDPARPAPPSAPEPVSKPAPSANAARPRRGGKRIIRLSPRPPQR